MQNTNQGRINIFSGQTHILNALFFLQMSSDSVQNSPPPTNYASPPIAIIFTIILLVIFFISFFSIFFCRCFIQYLLYTWHLRSSRNGIPIDPRVSANEQGLDPKIIKSFPTFTYSSVKNYRKEAYGLECAICLVEFEDDSLLRLVTLCNHVYHQECIDLWLESHKTCPVCRASLDSADVLQKRSCTTMTNSNVMHGINEDESEDSLSIIIQVDDGDDNKEGEKKESPYENSKRASATLERVELRNIVRKFSRSHSTGHSIDRARGAEDRFTLKLPEHVRAKIIKGHNSTKSCTTFGEYKSKTTTGNGGFGEVSESSIVDINKV